MKKLVIIILALFAFKAYPQINYLNTARWMVSDTTVEGFSMINYFASQLPDEKKNIIKNNIHEWKYQRFHINNKGTSKPQSVYSYIFDRHGNIISRKNFNNKNTLYKDISFRYNDSNKVVSYIQKNKKGKITFKDSALYNSDSKQTAELQYRRGGLSLKRTTNTSYNKKGKVTELSYFKYNRKGKEKNIGKDITTYNEDGTKGETKWFNGKGKLKHTWSFVCNPEGVSEKSKLKDSTKVCVKYDYTPDGSKIKSMIYTDRKNRVKKSILKYDPKGNLTEATNYNPKNKITTKQSYSYNTDKNITSMTNYKRGGEKMRWKFTMEYNSNKLCTKYTWYRHDKLKKTYDFDYNDKGIRTSTTTYNNKGKKIWLLQNSYEFF